MESLSSTFEPVESVATARAGGLTPEDLVKITVVAMVAMVDAIWIDHGAFTFALPSVVRVIVVAGLLLVFAEFYRRWRPNRDFVVMVRETAWLLTFSVAAAVLSNLVVTLNFPLVDDHLATWDRALHLNWPAYYAYVTAHPMLGLVSAMLYAAALPLIAVAIITLVFIGRAERASELVLAAMIGALIAIAISGLWPSAGALAYFQPDPRLALHHPIVDLDYKQGFFDLRSGAWRSFSLDTIRGLIAFPSYHAVLGAVVVLAFRGIRRVFWPVLALNAAMLASAPVEGGHHFVDVIGGVLVAVVATALASRLRRWLPARADGSQSTGIAAARAASNLS